MKRIRVVLFGLLLLGCLLSGGKPAAAGVAEVKEANRLHSAYLVLAQNDDWKWSPAVAYAPPHDAYLVVWENVWSSGPHDIYGRLVNGAGQMSGEFVVYSDSINGYHSKQPAVAYDSTLDRFLVVWSYDSAGDDTDYDIYGRFIPWSGPSGGELAFGIETSRASTTKPRLAYAPGQNGLLQPNEFLIVWKVEVLPPDPAYIAGGFIYDDKKGVAVAISSGPEVRDFPDVTYNAASNQFVAVWDEDDSWVKRGLDIYAIRLNAYGVAQPPGEFLVSGLDQNEQHPSVASCYKADQYFFVWQQQVNTTNPDENIFGRMMSGSGVVGQSYGVAGTTLPQRYPRLSCDPTGDKYFLVWHDQYAQPLLRWGVWGTIVRTDFLVEPAFEVVRPSDARDRLYPAVAYGNNKGLVVWQHAREATSFLDIWGQIVTPYPIFIPTVRK